MLTLSGDFATKLQGAQSENVFLGTNGSVAAKWRVLSTNDNKYSSGKMLLWSEKQFATEKYNPSYTTVDYAYWGTSQIRTRLNGYWYNTIFSTNERNDDIVVPTNNMLTDNVGSYSHQFNRDGITASGGGNGIYNQNILGTGVAQYARKTNSGDLTAAGDGSITSGGGVQETTSGDKLFFLDYYDINNASYGFANSNGTTYATQIYSSWTTSTSRFPGFSENSSVMSGYLQFSGENSDRYWLRNAGRYVTDRSEALIVNGGGCVKDEYVSNASGVRPAFNFDASYVVYATAANLTSVGTTLTSVTTAKSYTDGKPAYKLYIKDASATSAYSTTNQALGVTEGNDVKVIFTAPSSFTGGNATLILSGASGTEYQATVSASSSTSAQTVTFTLPTFPTGKTYEDYTATLLLTSANGGDFAETVYNAYTVSQVVATPKDVTQVFNGNDMLSPLDSVITDATWYNSDFMDLSCTTSVINVGTYTITAKLSALATTKSVEWYDATTSTTTTADQTFTFKVKQKPITYTLAKKVVADVYGDTDAGVVEASYTGVVAADVGTTHGPDLVIYYKSTDSYGYGTGAADSSGNGYGSLTAPTEVGSYVATAVDKNASTSNYKMSGPAFNLTIKPKQVNKPATVAALTYNGAAQKFTINNYDSALMDYGTSSGSTFTAGTLPAGMTKGAGAKDFEATNAGKYEIEFRLKTNASGKVRNYAWSDGTQTILKVPYEIKPKILEFTFTQPGTSWTVKVTDTGAITQTYAGTDGPISGETPRLQYYYYFQTDGAANKVVIPEGNPLNIEDVKDKNGNRTVGLYVTGVQFVLDSNGDPYPVNENYALGTSAEIANLTLTAGEAGIDGITLAYKDSTMGASDGVKPLPNGASALKYALDGSGNAVSFFPQLDFKGTVFEPVGDTSYACTDGSTPAFANGINKAGKVTVTVNIAIKASEQGTNKMPTAYSGTKFKTYTRTDDYHATVTFEYEIGKMEIDTSVFKLQYSYNQTDWKDFATTDNKVEFANSTIYVRIDPTSLKPAAAGINVMFGTNTYASGKNKNAYTASANFTLTDNDNFTIQSANYAWEITNKQINVTNWVPGDFKIDGVDHTGEIMVINGHKALYDAGVIEYVYTWSAMDGSSGSGAGEAELAKIFALASATNQVTVTATVQLKASAASTYDLSGTTLTSAPFYVGAAKTIANVTNAGSVEFGSVSESALGVVVEADGANLPATNAVTGALLYEIYLHDYDGLSVDNITGDGYGQLSGVDYSKLNAGKYVIEVRLTAAGSQDYALKGARQIFEIAPKKVTVPQVTGEITFNGGYINIVDYLDENYNNDIMSLVSGYTNKNAGDYTVTFKLANSNYEWVEPAGAEPASKKLFGKAILFVDGISIDNSALTATLDWKINKIVLGTGGWNLGSKEGVSLAALADYQKMIEDNQLDVTIGYRYYDTNGNLIEEPVLKGGDKYLVEAFLTGADAANFEFEDGTGESKSISAQQEYTVPQSGAAKFFGSVADFAKANWLWFVIGAAALLFLIILICIIASAKKKKKRRLAEEKAERERKEEREREERRLEREERMARMSQQQAMPQMMMPQMMPQMQMPQPQPQYAPQSQPMAMGGGPNEAQFMQMQAELAAVKAEQAAMRAEQNAVLRSDMNAMRNDYMMDKSGGTARISSDMSAEKLAEIITAAVKSALADETKPAPTANATPENSAASAAPVATQVPPDAVMTTVTTTKIDTTKKAQGTQGNAQATRQTRSFVPPMPVDDGRVFDVGGFYKPADPATDFNFDEDEKKD